MLRAFDIKGKDFLPQREKRKIRRRFRRKI